MSAPISVFLADDHTMVREALAGMLSKELDIQIVGQCGDGLKVVEMVRRYIRDGELYSSDNAAAGLL